MGTIFARKMNEYMVYFGIFGKRLKVRVSAPDRERAEQYVRSQLSIIKIEETPKENLNFEEFFEHIFKQ